MSKFTSIWSTHIFELCSFWFCMLMLIYTGHKSTLAKVLYIIFHGHELFSYILLNTDWKIKASNQNEMLCILYYQFSVISWEKIQFFALLMCVWFCVDQT
jgi:hypothetical protein